MAVWSKVMNILSYLPSSFQYFQFLWKGINIKPQQFVIIFCWNIYHQTCRCLFCLFTFWEEKKCNPVFNPWLSLLFNPWSSQGIYLHHSNPIVLKIPCAKFHASSCCQTKVKVERQLYPLPLPSPLPSPLSHAHPKRRFKKPTRNRVTNMIANSIKTVCTVWTQQYWWSMIF